MVQMLNIAELKEIYIISNTASFLFNEFSKDESVQDISINYSSEEIINAFLKIAKINIDKIDDLVSAYAYYIAIMLKNDDKAYEFFSKEGVIDFEWFNELRSIYNSQMRPTQYFEFEGEKLKTIYNKINYHNEQAVENFTFEIS